VALPTGTLSLLAPLLLVAPGCAPRRSPATPAPTDGAGSPADYLAVHIDTLDPARHQDFERARREWLERLAALGIDDDRGLFLQVGEHRFLTLRPFANFAELDAIRASRARSLARVPTAVRAAYDGDSDRSLVPPHRSEVWAREPALSYTPSAPVQGRCGEMTVEEIRPTPEHGGAQYERAWAQARVALSAAGYPLERRSWFSIYGEGRLVTLWLAGSCAELRAAPPLEQVLAERAPAALEALRDSTVSREARPVVVRPDLSSPAFLHLLAR
jgi:hypothetical protein